MYLDNYALTYQEVMDRYLANCIPPCPYVCETSPAYDYDGDCVMSVADIAIFAATWLECGRYPATECP